MEYRGYNVKPISDWKSDGLSGAQLITIPMPPQNLRSLSPSAIVGYSDMQIIAQRKYRPEMRCEICGAKLTSDNIRLQEKCDYDSNRKAITFLGFLHVCRDCFDGIHIADIVARHKLRSYADKEDYSETRIRKLIEHCFRLAHSPDGEEVLLQQDFLDCLSCSNLKCGGTIESLRKRYNIGFFGWHGIGKS